jgi:hypothetical protein
MNGSTVQRHNGAKVKNSINDFYSDMIFKKKLLKERHQMLIRRFTG